MKLTEKQERFIDYFIEADNAAEAARKAGYSKRTANRIGLENLKKNCYSTGYRKTPAGTEKRAHSDAPGNIGVYDSCYAWKCRRRGCCNRGHR